MSGNDVHIKTKDEALDFINKKFPDFAEEVAGGRSAEGWHFDSHPIGEAKKRSNISIFIVRVKSLEFTLHGVIKWKKLL